MLVRMNLEQDVNQLKTTTNTNAGYQKSHLYEHTNKALARFRNELIEYMYIST